MKAGGKHPKHSYSREVPEKVRDLINKMLTINPKKRITMEQVLSHPWLEKQRSVSQRNIFKNQTQERRNQFARRSIDVFC